jgi:hypothetical protein
LTTLGFEAEVVSFSEHFADLRVKSRDTTGVLNVYRGEIISVLST